MSQFKGTFTALVTPFSGEKIDFTSLQVLMKQQLDGGVDGFVINGTTAESPTLDSEEVSAIFDFARKYCGKTVPLIMGTGSNSTKASVEATQNAKALGADAALVVVPYYNKPPQRGLVEHFKSVANVGLPVILYNVPGRTITSLSVDSVAELSSISNVIGIKEASGNIDLMKEMKQRSRKDFVFLSGDDGTYIEFLAAGGDGVISVATHILPRPMVDWKKWVQSGMTSHANEDFRRYKKLIDMLFCEANPIPVKMALHKMGIISSPSLRLPLTALEAKLTEALVEEMQHTGVLK